MNPAYGTEGWQRPDQVAYREAYQDLARREGAGLIALTPAWKQLYP